MSHQPKTVPVLVVGAGPAGLTTAITLARHGVDCLLVERRSELSGLPRSTIVSTRSMELLRAWGLAEAVRAGGIDAEWRIWQCETLALAATGSAVPAGQPSWEQSALISPTAAACVPQDHLEPVLLDHLGSFESARVALGTEVIWVTSRPDGVRAALRDRISGEERVVEARHLVAADGAHSTVRTALGIAMRGPDRLVDAVATQFRAPLWALVGDHRSGVYSPSRPGCGGIFLPAGPGDRWLFGHILEPGRRLAEVTEAELVRRIRIGAGVEDLRPRIERIGTFSFPAQVAERFREGAAFLVGDAAHRVTPRGGTGMNTAVHDGHDVGWRLAWVLRGWAEPGLLDGYEVERRPVAEHNTALSADRERSTQDPDRYVHADLGGRIPHVWLSPGRSTLDLLGLGLTLFTGPGGEPWRAAAAALPGPLPLAVRPLDGVAARTLSIRNGGALLVREDGAQAGWFGHAAGAAGALRAAVGVLVEGAPSGPAAAREPAARAA